MASTSDQFTLLGRPRCNNVFEDFDDSLSGKSSNLLVSLLSSMRYHHPDMTVAISSKYNIDLFQFAAAGYAVAEIDGSEDAFVRIRQYYAAQTKDDPGSLGDGIVFARYKYTWKHMEFIVYTCPIGYDVFQFILFPPDTDETVLSNSKATDALLCAAGQAEYPYQEGIYVYDGYWSKSHALLEEVQKTSWKDVILNEKMKAALTRDIEQFFDNESKYKDFDVPWRRGIIFHGPPGNGKTFSLRALMHTLTIRPKPINVLYVKAIEYSWQMRDMFLFARAYAPCLLIIEDIDSLVTNKLQSYFFNEVDGLENNDGILMVATTNHLERLDGGIANRPSRFDRKYLFPNPSEPERVQYCELWRKKLRDKPIKFPEVLSSKISGITDGFSFAYLKEAFVSTLLVLARGSVDDEYDFPEQAEHREVRTSDKHPGDGDDDGDKKIAHLPLWVEIQKQVKILRKEMETTPPDDGDGDGGNSSLISHNYNVPLDTPKAQLPAYSLHRDRTQVESFSGADRIGNQPWLTANRAWPQPFMPRSHGVGVGAGAGAGVGVGVAEPNADRYRMPGAWNSPRFWDEQARQWRQR